MKHLGVIEGFRGFCGGLRKPKKRTTLWTLVILVSLMSMSAVAEVNPTWNEMCDEVSSVVHEAVDEGLLTMDQAMEIVNRCYLRDLD